MVKAKKEAEEKENGKESKEEECEKARQLHKNKKKPESNS